MNIEKLEVGMTVKNYKELCELLGEKIKSGTSKKAHIKEMQRHFNFNKSGHSFIISEIYEKPKEKDIAERKGIYNDIVQLLIMDLLSRNEGNIIITKEKLTKEIGLTNENYTLGYRNQSLMSEWLEVDNVTLGDFYKLNTNSISKIIDNALDSLQRKFIIHKQIVMMIQYNNDSYPRKANSFDRELIQTISKEALLTLGLKETDIQTRNANNYKFINYRNNLLKQRTQIKLFYNAIDIAINRKFINNEMKELTFDIMGQLERKGKLKELNDLYASKIIEKAEQRHNNTIEEIKDINKDGLKDVILARFSDVYVNNFSKMTDSLIRLNAPVINKNIFFNNGNNKQLSNDDIDKINDSLPF